MDGKTWLISLGTFILGCMMTAAGVGASFTTVRQDVEALKTARIESADGIKELNDIVRKNQVILSRVAANQDNIIKLLDRHDIRMSELEKNCRGIK